MSEQPTGDILVFLPARLRLFVGLFLLIACTAGILALVLLKGLSRPMLAAAWGVDAAVFIAGAVFTFGSVAVVIDAAGRRFRIKRRMIPFLGAIECPMTAEDSAILLRRWNVLNVSGEPVSGADVILKTGNRRVALARDSEEGAVKLAHELAGKLRIPITEGSNESAGRTRSARALTYSTWLAMIAVLSVIMWPAISGSKPIHFAPLSSELRGGGGFSMNIAPADSAFGKGLEAYNRQAYGESEDYLREAIKLREYNPEAYNMLAYALMSQNHLHEALEAAKQGFDQAKSNGNIADSVAEMYQRMGNFEMAAEWYEKSVSLQSYGGAPAETHAKFGETLLALHRRTEAVDHLEQAKRGRGPKWTKRAQDVLSGRYKNYRVP